MTTLVDTNILLDLIANDPGLAGGSRAQFEQALAGSVFADDAVDAELSACFAKIEDLDRLLEEALIEIARTRRPVLFLADHLPSVRPIMPNA